MRLTSSLISIPLPAMLALVLVALTLSFAFRLFFPTPLVMESSQAGASVFFASNRESILFPRDCVVVQWAVEGIDQVFLNNQPQIGSGETQNCLTNAHPTLQVHFRDGSQQTYELPVVVLSTSPLALAILLLTFLLVTLRRQQLLILVRQPNHPFLVLCVLSVLLYLFFTHLLIVSDTVATADLPDASTAITEIVTTLALLALLFIVSVVIAQNFRKPASPASENSLHLGYFWFAGGIATVILVAGIILTVNPRGMYINAVYSPNELLLRGSKTNGYQTLAQTPDIVVMGSSRAFTLSPVYIQQKTGLTAYNMAIEGGRIEDFLIQTRQMVEFPKVLFIEVQEGMPRQPEDIAARAPLDWLPFMSKDTALLTIQKRVTGLFDLHQFAESIYTASYQVIYSRHTAEWPEFTSNGFAVRPPISASQFQQALLLDIGRIPPERCEQVDMNSAADVRAMLTIVKAHHTNIIFYLSPWHPQYMETVMQDDPQYQTCHAATVDYLSELADADSQVFFLDFSNLVSINGLDTEAGYYDSQHLTETNSNRLIDRAADTLVQAYHAAQDA